MKFHNILTTHPRMKKPVLSSETETFSLHLSPLGKLGIFVAGAWNILTFLALVILFVLYWSLNWLFSLRFFSPKMTTGLDRLHSTLTRSLDVSRHSQVHRSYLIELSLQNMQAKRTRTMVTMGGMAIGIAFIVFLVSVGYGLQNLVISRVARLEELRQADVLPGLTPELSLNDETVAKFAQVSQVTQVMPVIAVVGQVSYEGSRSDMAVYGVTADYLKNSAIQPIRGQNFESNDTAVSTSRLPTKIVTPSEQNTLDAASATLGDEIGSVTFTINTGAWLRVREVPEKGGKLLGYTRASGQQTGIEVWGETYESNNSGTINDEATLGKWVKATVLLWQPQTCDETNAAICEDNYLQVIDDAGAQSQVEGYMAELSMQTSAGPTTVESSSSVLGVSTLIAQSGSLPLIEIASESAQTTQSQTSIVTLSGGGKREAVVNRSVLQIMGIKEVEAVGKEMTLTMVIVSDLQATQEKVVSAPISYRIVAVTPDEGTPVVYVPFMDLRSLGIEKFSQVKVVTDEPSSLPKLRSSIEAMGYGTVSVADTVAQIDNLFSSFRIILAIVGLVALSVAALGMFNTLTVSLLERTREVGLMKAMGMKSQEVQELFLTESIIMGFFGGIIGLVLGVAMGKLLSLVLSAFSLIKGVGFVDISYVPFSFVLLVVGLSILIGVLTGYFPARRATKISALNALRYE